MNNKCVDSWTVLRSPWTTLPSATMHSTVSKSASRGTCARMTMYVCVAKTSNTVGSYSRRRLVLCFAEACACCAVKSASMHGHSTTCGHADGLWSGSGRLWSLAEDALQHLQGHSRPLESSQTSNCLAPGVVCEKLFSQNMCHGAMFHLVQC